MEELERRGKNIRDQVRAEFLPECVGMLPKAQKQKINEWCDQVPVVGFNSGSYDLNLIKNHFAGLLADTTSKVRVAKKGNKIMFLLTWGFRFLDIINYLGPGTSYEKWVKAYGCKAVKSWFQYEWFDTPEKLDYPETLKGGKDMATNRGFRARDGQMVTYEQRKLGLSAYYDKRWVLTDGIHTEPIEFHT